MFAVLSVSPKGKTVLEVGLNAPGPERPFEAGMFFFKSSAGAVAISGAPHQVGANPRWWPIPSMRWWPIPSSDRARSNEWIEAKQTYVANQQSDTCLLQKWSPEDDRRNNYYSFSWSV